MPPGLFLECRRVRTKALCNKKVIEQIPSCETACIIVLWSLGHHALLVVEPDTWIRIVTRGVDKHQVESVGEDDCVMSVCYPKTHIVISFFLVFLHVSFVPKNGGEPNCPQESECREYDESGKEHFKVVQVYLRIIINRAVPVVFHERYWVDFGGPKTLKHFFLLIMKF